jgi:hypothetical protein
LNPSFLGFIKHIMRDSLKKRYTKHLLSTSSSLKNKRYSPIMVGGELKEVGQVFGKNHGSCLFSPLKLALVFISSYSWVIYLSLSYTNPVSPHTPSPHLKSDPLIITLLFGLCLSRVHDAKSFFMPHNVQEMFHLKPTILQYYHLSSSCQSIFI